MTAGVATAPPYLLYFLISRSPPGNGSHVVTRERRMRDRRSIYHRRARPRSLLAYEIEKLSGRGGAAFGEVCAGSPPTVSAPETFIQARREEVGVLSLLYRPSPSTPSVSFSLVDSTSASLGGRVDCLSRDADRRRRALIRTSDRVGTASRKFLSPPPFLPPIGRDDA